MIRFAKALVILSIFWSSEMGFANEARFPLVKLHRRASGYFFCSATIVTKKYAITAAHCVSDLDKAKQGVEFRDETGKSFTPPIYASGSFYNADMDTAILVGDFKGFMPVKVITEMNSNLEHFLHPVGRLAACGYPLNGRITCTEISNVHQNQYSLKGEVRGAGQVYPGMSGGSVNDLETGVIIGIISAMSTDEVVMAPTTEIFSDLLPSK